MGCVKQATESQEMPLSRLSIKLAAIKHGEGIVGRDSEQLTSGPVSESL
jgi:hypothetical protein